MVGEDATVDGYSHCNCGLSVNPPVGGSWNHDLSLSFDGASVSLDHWSVPLALYPNPEIRLLLRSSERTGF